MYTHSGTRVTLEEGAPTPEDVAFSFGRMVRLEGATQRWWTYLHFAFGFTEAALYMNKSCPDHFDEVELVKQSLIWDAHRAVTYFMPPTKRVTGKAEEALQTRIHRAWGIPLPGEGVTGLLKLAHSHCQEAEFREFGVKATNQSNTLNRKDKLDYTYSRILCSVWDRRYSPESTAGSFAETVIAYWSFFKDYDIERMRHRFGYKTPWIPDRYVYPNLSKLQGDHDG